jgi:hypothetical protein
MLKSMQCACAQTFERGLVVARVVVAQTVRARLRWWLDGEAPVSLRLNSP